MESSRNMNSRRNVSRFIVYPFLICMNGQGGQRGRGGIREAGRGCRGAYGVGGGHLGEEGVHGVRKGRGKEREKRMG